MLFEVPSGMLADILGRKRTLIAAGLVNAAAGVAMAASRGLFGVCAAMALEALSFNLASGTLEALTYDTLAENGQEARYIRQTSRQYTLYSAAQSAASLMSVLDVYKRQGILRPLKRLLYPGQAFIQPRRIHCACQRRACGAKLRAPLPV